MSGVTATVHVQIAASAASIARQPELYALPVIVQLFLVTPGADHVNGQELKRTLLRASGTQALARATAPGAAWPREATLSLADPCTVTAVAFVDHTGKGKLDFTAGPQPLGWLTATGGWGGRGSAVTVEAGSTSTLQLELRHSTPPPRVDAAVKCGARGVRNDCTLLHLWGSAYARGRAQGLLLGRQILDFLEFFIIEDAVGGPSQYAILHAIFASDFFTVSEDFHSECNGVVEGVICSTGDGFVESLGRVLDAVDVICLNAPTLIGMTLREFAQGRLPLSPSINLSLEQEELQSEAVSAGDGECSQFCAWGEATAGSDIDGRTIVGRNMDGECDVRKVTVSHFILVASDTPAEAPSPHGERAGRRYISALWPGAIGVQTGFNSAGLWCASNAGSPKPAPFLEGDSNGGKVSASDFSTRQWVLYGPHVCNLERYELHSNDNLIMMSCDNNSWWRMQGHPLNAAAIQHLLQSPLPSAAQPAEILSALHEVAAPSGGIRVSGQCLMIAQPFVGQSHGGGLVYEGDHTGGQIRTAVESAHPPWQSDAIMVTNHNMIRGCEAPYGGTDGAGPSEVHGNKLGFSTLWRYHAGANQLAALRRAKISIGTAEMKRLLQTVAAGFTEHSLVAKPNTLELEVAYGNLDGLWDAPYSTWHAFHFDDCFIASGATTTANVSTPKL